MLNLTRARPEGAATVFASGRTPRRNYGIEPRHIVSELPSVSGTHDAAAYALLNSTGLAKPWRFYTERLTGAGRWFFLATVIFHLSGFNALELQAHVPMLYAVAVWTTAIVAVFFVRPRLRFRAQHGERVCAGETLPVEVEVTQLKGPAGISYTVVPHRLPALVDAVPEDGVPLPPLESGQRLRTRLGLRCRRRGVYRLQGFRVETDFPLGLLKAYRTFAEDRRLLVYPRFVPLKYLHIEAGRRFQPGGVALASHLGDSFEYLGNREYREGDNIRDIDWRATARLSQPIVREYREEYFLRVAVILDTHIPPDSPATAQDDFERAVSLCASVSDYMARQEYIVDIFAAGPNLYHLTAGRSIAYLDQILDILACVDESPAAPFETLEPEIQENLAQINTIICVFLDWNQARQAFLHRMRQSGAGIKVIIARDSPCTLDPAADADLYGDIPVIARSAYEAGVEIL